MSIEVNGVTLPDIPSEVLEQYPYAVIVHQSVGSGASEAWNFLCLSEPVYYVAEYATFDGVNLVNALEFLDKSGSGGGGTLSTDGSAWENVDCNSTESALGFPVGEYTSSGIVVNIDLLWANFDIYCAEMDADRNLTATDTVWFANSTVDPNYFAPKSWFDGMARQVMRLTGTSDKLNTTEMLELAKGVEVGGSLAENERIYQVGTAASTLDMSGLLTSSAS